MPWSDYYVQGKEVSLLEEWKDILGYEGHYQVSNHGRVRSVKRNSTIILKGDCQPNGYKRVYLWKDGRKKNFLVHRLVGLSFLDNPNHYSDINHLDENKKNNYVGNLEWCTHKYNMNFGTVREKISKSNIGKTPWCKGKRCPQLSAAMYERWRKKKTEEQTV